MYITILWKITFIHMIQNNKVTIQNLNAHYRLCLHLISPFDFFPWIPRSFFTFVMIIKKHDYLIIGDNQRPLKLQLVTQMTDKFLRTLSLIGSAEDR